MNLIALDIPTGCSNIVELATDFAERADPAQFILPCAAPANPGDRIQFRILYADGSAALSGVGSCAEVYDHQEEDYPPEYRFDLVLQGLEFDRSSQVLFERILLSRDGGGGPATGEISTDGIDFADSEELSADEFAAQSQPSERFDAPPGFADPGQWDDSTQALSADSLGTDLLGESLESESTMAISFERVASRPQSRPPAAYREPQRPVRPKLPKGQLPDPLRQAELITRPKISAAWEPEVEPREQARRPMSPEFNYHGPLPTPASPPRPQMPEDLVIAPAPKPHEQS